MDRRDRAAFALLSLALLVALGGFGRHWSTVPEWATRPLAMSALTGVLVLFVAQYLQAWTTLPAMRRPLPPPPPDGLRVALATTFVPGSESLAMLRTTLEAMARVDYGPDVWVLDEGGDPAVEVLADSCGARYFSRAGRPEWNAAVGPLRTRTKYGNVNAWLREVAFDRYDVVAAFDPDHIPEPEFLERTLGYLSDPSIGFVQAAQVYYNQEASLVARGAAEETYAYYSSTLMAGWGLGYTVMVGCHNLHRVEALKEVGGLAAHDADDLLTALRYAATGWKGVYVPEVLAKGLTPVGWASYMVQQRRWARSVFDLKLRHLPALWRRLPRPARTFGLLQGAAYPIEALLPPLAAALLVFVLITGQTSVLSRLVGQEFLLLLLALAGIDVFRQRFYLLPRTERGLHWRAGLLRAAKWPAVLWGLAAALVGHRPAYEITVKGDWLPRGARWLLPHLGVGLAVGGAYAAAVIGGRVEHWSLHLWGPLVALGSVALFLSSFRPRPPAFDPDRAAARHRPRPDRDPAP
jgi:cellulose synthase/poly-beta-1,6-N-acetylglucosamine synthase-like glycosyltransferase